MDVEVKILLKLIYLPIQFCIILIQCGEWENIKYWLFHIFNGRNSIPPKSTMSNIKRLSVCGGSEESRPNH